MEHQTHEDIVMLNDILDYLNVHEIRTLLEINTERLTKLEDNLKKKIRVDITDHRQLVSIRQAFLERLGVPDDREHWLKV